MTDKAVSEMSFEEAMAALEQVVTQLERGEVALEQSIALYEKGAALKAHCAAKLKAALDKTMASPEFRKKMEESGSVVADPKTDAGKYINAEIAKYTKIVQFAHIEN